MVLAEEVADGIEDHTGRQWIFIEAHANELGLSGVGAVDKISPAPGDQRPVSRHERARLPTRPCPLRARSEG